MTSSAYRDFLVELNAKNRERLDYISEESLLELKDDDKRKAKCILEKYIRKSDSRAAVAFSIICDSDEIGVLGGWLIKYDTEAQLRVNSNLWCRNMLDDTILIGILDKLNGNDIKCKKYVVQNLYKLHPKYLTTKLLRMLLKENDSEVRSYALDELLYLTKNIERKLGYELYEYINKENIQDYYARLSQSSSVSERRIVVRDIWSWINEGSVPRQP